MANRTYNQFQGTLQKGVVTLFAKVTFDASGVATVVTQETINASTSPVTINPSNGFVSGTVTATVPAVGTNLYTFALQDPYVRLLSASVVTENIAVPGTSVIPLNGFVFADNVNSNSSPSIGLVFVSLDTSSGTIAPGAKLTSCTMLLKLDLANSTAL